MDLFELVGKVAIDNKQGVNALQEVSGEGEKAESKLGKAFSAIGKGAAVVGKAVATGMAAGAAAVGALVTKSIQAYADYEQLVGGVDTLFKESSEKVQEYAANAYKTAGLSANEYMETVTSFSASLLQSLDGDTEKAAEAANMAITDMSDNANKMGTSMEMIQNAYNGFAKQNYTMLDNLKLGYGGTKEEMARLLADAEKISGQKFDLSSYADVVDAIHVIQTEMGITGTTAKEASSTISGSLASMKGAWQNVLTAISSDELPFDTYVKNFVDSVSTVADNLMPRIEIALNGVVQLIEQLAPVIIGKFPELLNTLLPSVVTAAGALVREVIKGLRGAVEAVAGSLPALIDGLVQIFGELPDNVWLILTGIMHALEDNAPVLIDGLVQIGVSLLKTFAGLFEGFVVNVPFLIMAVVDAILANLPVIINAIVSTFNSFVEYLPEIVAVVASEIPTFLLSISNALIENLPVLIQGIISMISAIANALPEIINTLAALLPQIIQMLVDALIVLLPEIINGIILIMQLIVENLPIIVQALVDALPLIISSIFTALWELLPVILESLWTLLGSLFDSVWDLLGGLLAPIRDLFDMFFGEGAWDSVIQPVLDLCKEIGGAFKEAWEIVKIVWDVVKPYFKGVWEYIKGLFSAAFQIVALPFKNAWEGIKLVFGVAVDYFKTVWANIKAIFSVVKNVLTGNFREAWEGIKSIFSNWGSFFSGLWDRIKTTFSNIGTNIGNAISGAVKSGINGVIGMIEGVINTGINMINGAIGLINKIPGVEIGKFEKLKLPRLAKGGVLEKGQVGLLEGDGAEAVVPLDQNRAWISRVAQDMNVAVGGNNDGIISSLAEIRDLLVQFFPDVMNALLSLGYAPDEATLARWLAPAMNKEFGRLAIQEGRGR